MMAQNPVLLLAALAAAAAAAAQGPAPPLEAVAGAAPACGAMNATESMNLLQARLLKERAGLRPAPLSGAPQLHPAGPGEAQASMADVLAFALDTSSYRKASFICRCCIDLLVLILFTISRLGLREGKAAPAVVGATTLGDGILVPLWVGPPGNPTPDGAGAVLGGPPTAAKQPDARDLLFAWDCFA